MKLRFSACRQARDWFLAAVGLAALLVWTATVAGREKTSAAGETHYVASDGDDGQPGTKAAPLRTIQKAAAIARAGDTVLVRAGVYKGQVFLRFSGEPDKPIVFKNYPGERAVVDGAGRGRIELQSEHGWQKPVGWITVEGFEVRNGWDGSHNTIAFQQNRAGIVVWQSDATDCVIQNNILYQNAVTLGSGSCQGIDFVAAGGGHLIRHNLFFAPQRTAISKGSGDYTATDNLETDPQFVAAERFDFRLRAGSPAIDAAARDQPVAADLDGTTRPQGGSYDIGAYEHRE